LNRALAVSAAAIACVLAACGGELSAGIEGSGAPVASSVVTSVGTITGFGSIIVDDVEYATSGAQIRIDDEPAAESQLRIGEVVTIKGTLNPNGTTGTATDVSFSSDARGPVTQVDAAAGTFVVLGQTIRVTDDTLFDASLPASDLSALNAAVVQISGFANAAGDLVASRIDRAAPGQDQQVRGIAKSVDASAHTFRVNGLTVDYTAANVAGVIAEGSVVTVRGNSLARSGALLATRVTVSSSGGGVGGKANERGQVEGLIASFTSNNDFVVNGQRVATDANTQFVLHGVTLGLNVQVKVKGTFNAAGVLLANKVEVKQKSSSMVRGVVDSITNGALSVLGLTVATSADTVFEDRSSENARVFRLGDLRAGDYVEVRASPDASSGALDAVLVVRGESENRVHLQGVALGVAEPGFTVLGVSVVTNAQTHFVGGDGAAEFFSGAAARTVKVRGTLSGKVLIAEQIQLTK
jgi:hypothetical protein